MWRRTTVRNVAALLACSMLAGVAAAPLHHLLHHGGLATVLSARQTVCSHGHVHCHGLGHAHGHSHGHSHQNSDGSQHEHDHDDCVICHALAAKMLPAVEVTLADLGEAVRDATIAVPIRVAARPLRLLPSRAPPVSV